MDTTRYGWLEEAEKSFKFSEFRRGLEWFSQTQGQGCLKGGGAPCENRRCAAERKLASCLQCGDYMICHFTEYQRSMYPFVAENYARVKEVGLEKHLEEEDERARAGVSLISHLERRYCKRIKIE